MSSKRERLSGKVLYSKQELDNATCAIVVDEMQLLGIEISKESVDRFTQKGKSTHVKGLVTKWHLIRHSAVKKLIARKIK